MWIDALPFDHMWLRTNAVQVDTESLGYFYDVDDVQRGAHGCEARGTQFQRARHRGHFGETIPVHIDLEATMLRSGSDCVWTGRGEPPFHQASTSVEVPISALQDGNEDIVADSGTGLVVRLQLRGVSITVG